MTLDKEKLENFEHAFSSGTSGCRRTCHCGKEFYDFENSYDWEEGELEKLTEDKNARGLPYSVGDISFEGREYVSDCDCWHKRALHIITFLESHMFGIAEYFKLEKTRRENDAKSIPVIDP